VKPLLIDFGPLSCGCTDHALEALHKAQSQADDSLWTPHHDPYVRDHIEAVTARGTGILGAIVDGLYMFMGGGRLAKAAGSVDRWTPAQLKAVRERLEAKGRDNFTLEDWLTLVDWIIQRYLPESTIMTEAEYLAVRAAAAGKIQAATEDRNLSDKQIAALVGAAPSTIEEMARFGKPLGLESSVLQFARARAAEFVTDIGERTRHRMKSIIIAHQENVAIGSQDGSVVALQQKLSDEFAILNRDWRRIAITETARDANEGFLAALPEGTRVRRVEAYTTACPFCKSINGTEYTIVSPSKPDKNGETEVWIGKTNVGRSASPRKRSGDVLVERSADEMWWAAAGTVAARGGCGAGCGSEVCGVAG
jgi:predicted XRE-type DNA-binding protein